MDKPSASIRDLARRLLSASRTGTEPDGQEITRLCEKLRISLTRFAGADGFTSLLRRALALTSAEVPFLQSVKIGTNGRLEGLEKIAAGKAGDAAVALTAHLLWLLVTFIGEPLALKLVRENWPDATLTEKKQ
jgi:hypothetical protein